MWWYEVSWIILAIDFSSRWWHLKRSRVDRKHSYRFTPTLVYWACNSYRWSLIYSLSIKIYDWNSLWQDTSRFMVWTSIDMWIHSQCVISPRTSLKKIWRSSASMLGSNLSPRWILETKNMQSLTKPCFSEKFQKTLVYRRLSLRNGKPHFMFVGLQSRTKIRLNHLISTITSTLDL